jgi:dTDP-4-dehydrorhamnose reductase
VAHAARRHGARLIHLSTDYVFDGSAHSPYGAESPAEPLNVYGSTKREGERRVLASGADSAVVRTAWLHSRGGTNFVRTTLRVLGEGRVMRVVDDQIGTPTRARHLAHALWRIVERPGLRGMLHFTDCGVASWFDVATAIMDALGEAGRLPPGADVVPIKTTEYPAPARRPLYSVLDKHDSWRAIGYTPPHWRHGVVATVHELLDA